ncbi:Rho GTPase-activating protein 32 like protein [Argiope bruennichi]|uniref:Rho GTPase-activating protein 32 like protein n=2 Tax=Argiope bruennichi TaxID=94029 RepID=A0A8T0EZR8_ARGBR|nr:Rho GTPase-activating protein 32 like protein [Argiope bruennichi]
MLMAPPNVKIKHITRSPSSSGDTRFPKLDECAHFHYENVELGPIQVFLCDKQNDSCKSSMLCSSSANKENENEHMCFLITVVSNSKKWVVRRSYRNFMFLDTQLHRCVYDRKYSLLQELPHLPQDDPKDEDLEDKIRNQLSEYLERFSQLAGSLINCGPVLNWFELDNRGNRLIVTDEAINTPAVAAAYVVVPYTAQATDEISFDVGDMISVIDMPPPAESSWWRGKKGFEVGFFPSECVEVIGDKIPHSFKLSNSSTKPVFRRHGKLIAFFRSFLLSRPSRRRLKQSGILKERVFGCDLGEHLLNTGRDIPLVLKCCAEFIEEYGIVDGIYRLSGVSSNIQRLRLAFDEDRPINLGDPATVHDIHSVASLLKMYFRELPNPLLTYQLYDKFVSAMQCNEDVRLLKVRDVVQQLPPPHFRTLQYLLSHLARVASHGEQTGMTPKNIAIVWAPNLLRSRDVENGGVGALHVVGIQAVLTEYLIRFSDLIFDDKASFLSSSEQEGLLRARPKSLAISTPTKLLSLEEARARALSTHLPASQQKYIEVGGGPEKLPSKYHTVIELPSGKHSLPKLKKSPSGWKSFFSRGWYSGSTRDKSRPSFRSARKASTGSLPHHSAFMQEKPSADQDASFGQRKKLRTVKSAESLAHCLKESPHSTNNDDFSGNTSCKSSPHVSVESSHSFEMSSPLSKSPGLQKHTRSSSHESYFESNSMDIISEPSFEEDEHGLFYYVSEQMRMLQDSSQWSTDKSTLKEDSVSMKSSEFQDLFDQQTSEPEVEKNVRKQKLSTSDEFAQTKYQKLNETDQEFIDPKNISSTDATFEFDHLNSDDNIWETNDEYNDTFSPETEDLTLDPVLLYEAVINKRNSVVSSSDTENEPNDRTVVERYGNAETVLVEVHATQDSSSEEEHYSPVPDDSPQNAVVQPIVDATFDLANLPYSPGEEIQDYKLNFSDEDGSISPSNMESDPALVEERTLEEDEVAFETVEDRHGNVMSEIEVLQSSETHNEVSTEESNSPPVAVTPELEIKAVESSSCNLENLERKEKFVELNLETSKTVDSSLDEFDNSSFSIISPPSPVYPPKSLKLHEFQSLKTKMDKLPLHKKKQIHIPSPSSPVDEVRKKFELRASSSNKSIDSPTNEIKFRSQVRDLTPKLVKTFEVSETVELAGSQQTSTSALKTESMIAKRHSEPPPKTIDSNTPTDIVKRMSNKYEIESTKSNKANSEKQTTKPSKPLQPSLFTQLKIRKLQSLKAEPAPEPVDPWSDPILDMQEDYHPIVTYLPSPTSEPELSLKSSNEYSSESDLNFSKIDSISKPDESKIILSEKEILKDEEQPSSPNLRLSQKDLVTESINPSQAEKSSLNSESTLNSEIEIHQSNPKLSETPESEAVKRERINRIKEERRAQLREKLKQESFRMEAEEKEKVQTKFRLRKEGSKHHLLSDSQEEHCKDVKKSDKAVETDSADITETGTNCDLSSPSENLSNMTTKSDSSSKPDEDVISRCRKDSDSTVSRNQKCKSQQITSGDYVLLQNKSNSGKKSMRSYEDNRKWLSMPPTDIRDKVAMFERSKDTNELCRLGPNGKFPQKQSPSALASSFVR